MCHLFAYVLIVLMCYNLAQCALSLCLFITRSLTLSLSLCRCLSFFGFQRSHSGCLFTFLFRINLSVCFSPVYDAHFSRLSKATQSARGITFRPRFDFRRRAFHQKIILRQCMGAWHDIRMMCDIVALFAMHCA